MKKILLVIAVLFSLKNFGQGIAPAPEDKAVVYFVRLRGLEGSLKNFRVFDGKKTLGEIKSGEYIRYECKPGEHVFWGKSDNKDFLTGELLAGKNYIVKLVALESKVTVKVILNQVDSTKKILKLINKKAPKEFSEEEMEICAKSDEKMMVKTMGKYKEKRKKGKKFKKLDENLFYQP